jgi:hypothetical protein
MCQANEVGKEEDDLATSDRIWPRCVNERECESNEMMMLSLGGGGHGGRSSASSTSTKTRAPHQAAAPTTALTTTTPPTRDDDHSDSSSARLVGRPSTGCSSVQSITARTQTQAAMAPAAHNTLTEDANGPLLLLLQAIASTTSLAKSRTASKQHHNNSRRRQSQATGTKRTCHLEINYTSSPASDQTGPGREVLADATNTSRPLSGRCCPGFKSKQLFLVSMMPTLALSLLVLTLAAGGGPQVCRANLVADQEGASRFLDEALAAAADAASYAPTRRPSAAAVGAAVTSQSFHSGHQLRQPAAAAATTTTTYSDQDGSMMTPNRQQQMDRAPSASGQQHQHSNPNSNTRMQAEEGDDSQQDRRRLSMTMVPDGASSMESAKFTRTNELEAFLDDMNHRELQTVAAGRPIEDLFQPKTFDTSPVASHSSQPRPSGSAGGAGAAPPQAAATGRAAAGLADKKATTPDGSGGLIGSHSEQQIYSDCALILQRTYVKNMEDSK